MALATPLKRKLDQLEEPGQRGRHTTAINSDHREYLLESESMLSMSRASSTVLARDIHEKPARLDASGDSVFNSTRVSPTPSKAVIRPGLSFDQNASIVLIGIRGTGKSSLAVILATATGRRLIDADLYFQKITGLSRLAFKKQHDVVKYREQEAKVMESMLYENGVGFVIACDPGSLERSGESILRDYAKSHPVIHVVRDAEGIQSYLKAWDIDKVRRLLELSGPLYRACSNLEYFNISETASGDCNGDDDHPHSTLDLELDHRSQTPTPYMTLKRVQRDFLRFVALATGNAAELANIDASFPLSMMPIEARMYTYSVSVPLSAFLDRTLDIEDLESCADAFELCIDVADDASVFNRVQSVLGDTISQTVANIRRNTIVPLIYHVEPEIYSSRTPSSPPTASRRSDQTYLSLVEHGLRLAPEFLTVDLLRNDTLLSQIIAGKGSTRIIGQYAARQSAPQTWDDVEFVRLYKRATELGCDMVRLSQPAASMEDNFAVQRFRHRIFTLPGPHLPLIAYNTGPLGRLSCCFNPILTPVTHESLASHQYQNYSPLITVREAQEALFSSFALDPMHFTVFGANVSYSLSPAMHNTAYKVCGMPHEYRCHQSPTLRGVNELVEDPNFGGSSVSLPYKTEIIPLLHSMSPHARIIGAVNTLIPIRKLEDLDVPAGKSGAYLEKSRAGPIRALHGDNTDWIGICNCIRRGLSPANAVRPSSTGLVIGAGGMARAAIYSMIHLGVQNIFVHNRTIENAEKLAQHYNRLDLNFNNFDQPQCFVKPKVHVVQSLQDPWPNHFKPPTIIVSGIPAHSIGGQPAPNFKLPSHWIESPTGGVVVDLAYKPLTTPLIKQMRSLSHRGWVALDGLDVLPEQGFAQFELFTGRRAPRRLMRAVVLKEYKSEEGYDDATAMQSRLESLDGRPN